MNEWNEIARNIKKSEKMKIICSDVTALSLLLGGACCFVGWSPFTPPTSDPAHQHINHFLTVQSYLPTSPQFSLLLVSLPTPTVTPYSLTPINPPLLTLYLCTMGFPLGCTDILLPKLLIIILSLLHFLRYSVSSLFALLGLPDFFQPNRSISYDPTRIPECPPLSAVLTRELLPVVLYEDVRVGLRDPTETCAVCLLEFRGGEEIRWLTNCKHIFHRGCLDRWMDHDQNTCPLCRTPFVPFDLQQDFNRRLWAASGVDDF